MANKVESLDQLLREKAEAQLREEVKNAFRPLGNYFTGMHGASNLNVTTTFGIRREGEPSGVEHTYTLSVSEVLRWLQEKAIANLREERGNQAVLDFMNRVQEVGEQLDELRETVDNHVRE